MIQIQCAQCGKQYRVQDELAGSDVRCPACGSTIHVDASQPTYPPPPPPVNTGSSDAWGAQTYASPAGPITATTSGLAIAALVLGIISPCVPLLGIVALVLGIVAIGQIDKSQGRLTGRGMATAGSILGGVGMLLSVVALMVGILLPALGSARRAARMMQNNTQLRGIHQGMVIYGQGNNRQYPGLDANGRIFDGSQLNMPNYHQDGSTVEVRFQLLLENNLVSPEFLLNPGEMTKYPWGQTGVLSADYYSYSMLQIHGSSTGAGDVPDRTGRAREWHETFNTQAPILSDRTLDASNYQSLWSTTQGWRGGVAFNDGAARTEQSHVLRTRYAQGPTNDRDDLFSEAAGAANTTPPYSNALMIYAGHQQVDGP